MAEKQKGPKMIAINYDIESTPNFFEITLTYDSDTKTIVKTYYITDNETLNKELSEKKDFILKKIKETYPPKQGKRLSVDILPLNDTNFDDLFNLFGFPGKYAALDKKLRIPKFDFIEKQNPNPTEPVYYMGYNSSNYDLNMLAYILSQVYVINDGAIQRTPITAAEIREFSDKLFENKSNMNGFVRNNFPETAKIKATWIKTGRHIDVAQLNEKQRFVGLKKILAILGYQILESDKLSDEINTVEDFLEMTIYNISDCLNLDNLRNDSVYKSALDVKHTLLTEYFDDLIFTKDENGKKEVRFDRLTLDSSSARFVAKILSPSGTIADLERVSYLYPHIDKAKELGVEQINVLDFVYSEYNKMREDVKLRTGNLPPDKFKPIFDFYRSIEGKNFNNGERYEMEHPNADVYELSDFLSDELYVFYMDKDGNDTSCYAHFSTGGIHGAQINKKKFEIDCSDIILKNDLLNAAKAHAAVFNTDDTISDATWLRKQKEVTLNNITYPYKEFITGPRIADMRFKDPKPAPAIFTKTPTAKEPKINKTYTFSSDCVAWHNDFKSYYPGLLQGLNAFKTNNETDRYANIYDLKEEYTVLLKDENLTQEDRKAMNQLRNGYKLILNTASGVGDASFDNEIRMNNRIISMRIIGQLFTYLVAQKLTFYGGEVPSTNTDGLYATGLSAELNEKALGEYAKNINVEIEPESLKIISKDSNNRIEFNPDTYKVYSASGGTLAGYFGYSADKALDHAPIIDRFLAEYMMREGVENDFDEDKMRKIIDDCIKYKDSFEKLNYFAFIFSASGSSIRYPYAVTKDGKVKPLLKYNRGFLVKENTEGSCFMKVACVKKIGNNVKESRIRNGKAVEQIDLEAKDILKYWGENLENLAGYDIISSKINRIDETDEVLIFNQNLHALSDEESENLFDLIDIDKYIHLTKLAYENNWQNKY